MATITVRGLDDDVIRALKVRAASEGRSMEAEIRGILIAATRSTNDERGFGTLLADAFGGAGPVDIPARDQYPEAVDLP